MPYQTHDTEDFFCDDTGTIGGEACVDVDWVNTPDGPHVYVTLISVRVGNLTLTANQMADAFGAKRVVDYEARLVEEQHEVAA